MRAFITASALVLLPVAPLGACGDDDHDHAHSDDSADATSVPDGDAEPTGRPDLGSGDGIASDGKVVVSALGEGVSRAVIDASDAEVWVYVNVVDGAQVSPDEGDGGGWDLAFQRTEIRTAHPMAAIEAAFETVSQAPATGYVEDGEQTAVEQLGHWYDYDSTNHTVSPHARTFVVMVADDKWFKLAVRDYYDDAGTSGHMTVDWAEVAAPAVVAPEGTFTAPSDAHVDLATRGVVESGWDLSLVNGVAIATASGTSAAAHGGARLVATAWDAVESSDTLGFTVDAMMPFPGPPGSPEVSASAVLTDWFDYDVSTHALTPKDKVFVVRGADGDYFKLRISAWDATAGFTFQAAPLTRAPADHTLTVAAGGGAWAYVSLRDGVLLADVADAASDARWDLGFNGAMVRTSSGVSGPGQGGAALLGEGALGDFDTVGAETAFTADATLPNPGPPGSGDHGGNAVLEGFYDYNPSTHEVTVKPVVFAVKTADGALARVLIKTYADDTYTFDFTFAGPGHASF